MGDFVAAFGGCWWLEIALGVSVRASSFFSLYVKWKEAF